MGAGEGEPQAEKDTRPQARRSRAAGCLSVILMLASLPILVVGFLTYTSSREDAAAHSGIGGALSGLGVVVGIGAMVFAVVLFLVGAFVFVRAAKE